MILVIGGYAQGKLVFAKQELGVKNAREDFDGDCIYNLQHRIAESDFELKMEKYLEAHPDAVLICDEVGYGIVPLDQKEREYREKVGRVCCRLAASATAVYRVVAGIGMKLK